MRATLLLNGVSNMHYEALSFCLFETTLLSS